MGDTISGLDYWTDTNFSHNLIHTIKTIIYTPHPGEGGGMTCMHTFQSNYVNYRNATKNT